MVILCLLLSGTTAAGQVDAIWREASGFVPLFAPAGGRAASYRTYVSPLDLDIVLPARR